MSIKIDQKHTFIGSALALILAFSCCWLPMLIVALGSTVGLVSLSEGLEEISGFLMTVGVGMLSYGLYKIYEKKRKETNPTELALSSTITCPECSYQKSELMPTVACQYFYDCDQCHSVLKPKKGDCCVYCSYGTIPCPPTQRGMACC